jgi:hypothetical protein
VGKASAGGSWGIHGVESAEECFKGIGGKEFV